MNSKLLLSFLFASTLAACGGDSEPTTPPAPPPPPAPAVAPTHLAYTDPTSSGWRLVKDASSTDTTIV
ncbi:MAG: hypothetical protein ABJD97_11895, partial [Betaproteobacteria bacterium]